MKAIQREVTFDLPMLLIVLAAMSADGAIAIGLFAGVRGWPLVLFVALPWLAAAGCTLLVRRTLQTIRQ